MGGPEDKQLAYYRLSTEQVLKDLRTDKKGLASQEAKERLEQNGPNELVELHREAMWHKYLRQYKDLMILLLVASSFIAFVTSEFRTGVVLAALVFFNTLIGFTQEYKAERLMESLEHLVVPEAKVLRDGSLEQIASSQLVTGDIIYIEEGDSIPADLRLINETELATNDFALTGESNPSRKFTHALSSQVELANRHNLVFMGTTVATGHGYGVVVATGMHTELGRIASLSAEVTNDLSPLQKEMKHIATRVTQGTVLLCAALLPVAIHGGLPFKDALLFAIAFASSLIPNGLPAAINTSLAEAANKLVKARALVKKLSAVETLGATSVILTDKTGTLTKNQMTVERLLIGRVTYSVSGTGYEPKGHIQGRRGHILSSEELSNVSLFFTTGVFASNARVNPPDQDHALWYTIGDPTEGALLTLAQKAGIDTNNLEETHPELKEFAFDSARKRMSSIRKYGQDDKYYVFVKGAPESILHHCEDIWLEGRVRKMSQKDRDLIDLQNHQWAHEAYRNLGFAYKAIPRGTDIKKLNMDDVEKDLVWLGMVAMVDPLRDEVPEAMAAAHKAHVKVSVITGDFAPTAAAIARKAGLAGNSQEIIVVSGEELRHLDDARVLRLAQRGGTIFSRVSPEDKLRIVALVKNSGAIVAVTGDGINDAPALKQADIGVAMGVTGTDVAKQSAEIVLLDDSFHTLVSAVQQGRVIFQNIKKSTLSAFTSNTAELAVNLFSLAAIVALHIPLALSVMLILAIDLIAELFPIAALGWDQATHDLMSEHPRSPKDHILHRSTALDLLWRGFLVGGLAFGNYLLFFYRRGVSPEYLPTNTILHAQAMALTYLTLVLCLFINILQTRSSKGLFTKYQFHNRALGIAFLVSLICVLNILYNPVVTPYFGTAAIGINDWLFALGAAGLFTLVRELQRHADTHHHRNHILQLLQESAR